jgi:fumarylacetoacetate (FAA) hydrolase
MKFVTFSTSTTSTRTGLLMEDGIQPLPFASMLDLIEAGEAGLERVRHLEDTSRVPLDRARLHAPLTRPATLRDAYAFETHVKTANANRGREVPEEWYKFPIFYFTNPNNIYGPEDEIPYPSYTKELDYELEIAVVIGRPGRDLRPQDASKHIFGYTVFNDWSARDIQREEMKVSLGPAKGKDFASALGPCIVTADELEDRFVGRPGVFDLEMCARVNGVERSRGNFKDIYWSFGDILARASESVTLQPGDVIGSGTVGTGCLLEITKAQGPWLQKGDLVELEIERIGVLRNKVGN